MLSMIYLEITNVCNRSCAFCPSTQRPAWTMRSEEFSLLAAKLRPHTDYLYLHVMGEPLVHPQLEEILARAGRLGFRVVLTTNGTLLPARQQTLLDAPCLHKVHVSLHSFEANDAGNFEAYLDGCTAFGLAASKRGVLVNYRLWNLDGAEQSGLNRRNEELLLALHRVFPDAWQRNTWGWRAAKGVFVQYGERFDWPERTARDRGEAGHCRALRDQAAVLCDGTVVPCCLDHEGDMALGNLFTQRLEEILTMPEAVRIRTGFAQGKRVHPLCRSCGYADRFGT